jgi:hypothetical protein
MSHKTSDRRTRAQIKAAEATIASITPIASPFPESPPEDGQTSQSSAVDLPSLEVPFEVPLPLETLSKDQNALQNLVGGVPKDLSAVVTPPQEQSNTESLTEDSNTVGPLTAILSAKNIPSDDPLVKESSATSLHSASPSASQRTMEVPAGDQRTSEDLTAQKPTEKVLKDPSALKIVLNDKSVECSIPTNLSQGGVPKGPTEIISEHQPMLESPSTNLTVESLPIIQPASEVLPISEEPSGKTSFHHLLHVI